MAAIPKSFVSSVAVFHAGKRRRTIIAGAEAAESANETRRRVMVLSSVALASSAAAIPEVSDSRKALLEQYLKRSKENKAKNDKERLDDYYKRNYKDYFEFIEGSVQGKTELSEAEKGILDWLKANK
ncbi:hypothetical protein H6P81_020762 [Aristolochia fimbriata]|uniref:Uncharacterized protein n=1 Tax=Aristolochia fimbriata TaxID=158543 RepID=A0AAV7DYI0_ARIFI|nr:hypothetical protein H6P81_020762 [Aristolochia fimbriata]